MTFNSGLVVAGVDPSLTSTGVVLSTGATHVVGRQGVTKLPEHKQHKAICDLAVQVADCCVHADLVVVERPVIVRAAGGVVERIALWWDICDLLGERGIPYVSVPNSLRFPFLFGSGKIRDKGAVVDAVARRFPDFVTGGSDDVADALVYCAMGAQRMGVPLADMPKANLACLDRINWPV